MSQLSKLWKIKLEMFPLVDIAESAYEQLYFNDEKNIISFYKLYSYS